MRHFLLSILFITSLFSQELFNSNLLSQRAINPDILNNVVSSTRQNIAYRMKIEHSFLKETQRSILNYNMIVDPYPSYGTELQMQIKNSDLEKVNKSDIKKSLDELMGVQLYIQHGNLYDLGSLKLVSEDDNETIISFTFNKDALPRELKHMRDMKGYVYILNNVLDRIEVKNDKRFEMRDIEVDQYLKITYFNSVKSGGYLMSKESLSITGTYENTPYVETLHGTITQYWNAQRKEITFEDGQRSNIVNIDDSESSIISIDLDRFFPILGKEARKAGYDLPKPFGVSLINMFQYTNMHMTSFEINEIPLDFNKVLDGDSTYQSITYSPLIRTDIWVLPFVSVGLIVGVTDTNTDVTLASDSGLTIPIIGEIIKPGATLGLPPLHTNALLYGVGATVAGGFDNYFTTIDFQYILAYTPAADVSIDMMIITPLVGYTFSDYNSRVFIGAQYQRLAQSLTFDVTDANGNRLSGVVGLRSDEWAGVIGTDYSFTRNWSANLLYSQGIDRRNMILGISYRF